LKTAIISGVSGQDGAYLSEHLLKNNYRVIGLVRTSSNRRLPGLAYLGIEKDVEIVVCDLLDKAQVTAIVEQYQPDEIYNLAAQSSVSYSFEKPIDTFEFNTISVFNFLEAIRAVNFRVRFYQASSSEMCGKVNQLPITEQSVLHPLSPYATSKVAAHFTCTNYRESYGIYVACGILFNHESYLRNENFFVKKVLTQSIEISLGKQATLEVGNIDVKRDFGYSPSYVKAMHQMLQLDEPSDFLVCSGKSISLRSIIYHVFGALNIPLEKCHVNPAFFRPNEILDIYGDNSKAKNKLNWDYDYTFNQVLDILLEEELKNWKKS
jgi:GDPmannose 4,6-dehydratase